MKGKSHALVEVFTLVKNKWKKNKTRFKKFQSFVILEYILIKFNISHNFSLRSLSLHSLFSLKFCFLAQGCNISLLVSFNLSNKQHSFRSAFVYFSLSVFVDDTRKTLRTVIKYLLKVLVIHYWTIPSRDSWLKTQKW